MATATAPRSERRRITLAEKQAAMRLRHEPGSRKLARAAAQVRRVIEYLEKYPSRAHADAMNIAETAWFAIEAERMEVGRGEWEAKRCWFKSKRAGA